MREGRLGYNSYNKRYGLLSSDLWIDTGFHCGECLEVLLDDEWVQTRMEMNPAREWYLVGTPYCGDLEYIRARIPAQTYRPQERIAPQGARVLLMDGTAVESAFALLLTKVTKPPYPANISFYTIAGKDTNLCAMSGTGFRKRGEEYDDETNNQWYDRDRVSGS